MSFGASTSGGKPAIAGPGPSSNWQALKGKITPSSNSAKNKSSSSNRGGAFSIASTLSRAKNPASTTSSTPTSARQRKSQARREFIRSEQQAQIDGNGGHQADFKRGVHGDEGDEGKIVGSSSRPYIPHPQESRKDDLGVALLPIPEGKDNRLVRELRDMVAGLNISRLREKDKVLAMDCEMVGTGPDGSVSVLARVSIVNFHGHVVLDTFVRPRERVTDWRTWVSGVKESDMWDARTFEDVQKEVASLVEGKILIGHAIENDSRALLLSHPSPLLRDTQTYSKLREIAKTKKPGLKKLTELELGIKIQSGAHSSVTDARATMALYRLHKSHWESVVHKQMEAFLAKTTRKRKSNPEDEEEDDEEDEHSTREKGGRGTKKSRSDVDQFPGGGRKGISSGLSLIIKHRGGGRAGRGGRGNTTSSTNPSDVRYGGTAASSGGTTAGGTWWEDM